MPVSSTLARNFLGSNKALTIFLTKAPFFLFFPMGGPFPRIKAGRGGRTIANSNAKMNAYHAASRAVLRRPDPLSC
jgi:hypothetical protein